MRRTGAGRSGNQQERAGRQDPCCWPGAEEKGPATKKAHGAVSRLVFARNRVEWLFLFFLFFFGIAFSSLVARQMVSALAALDCGRQCRVRAIDLSDGL